jgi:hypothetical protein
MIWLALAAGVFLLLVWAGRGARRAKWGLRAASAFISVLAAVGAVAAGLRGAWLVSVALIAVSLIVGGAARARPGRGPGGGRSADDIGLVQARAILGVAEGASREEIEAAYRRLIRRAHPDQGGTSGLAAQLNAARDRLLK